VAFVISGALAGLSGYFAAAQFGFVAPQMLGWHVSATALVMVLIGGLRSVTGPLVGALVLIELEEVLKASTDYWKLIEGLIVIAIVIALPNGVRQLMPLVFGSSDNDDASVGATSKAAKSATGASHG
jgi:branched-chain amino acid transport system permease protein